jgi:hypothetical protein
MSLQDDIAETVAKAKANTNEKVAVAKSAAELFMGLGFAPPAAQNIVTTARPIVKYGIPVVGLLAGGWLFGIPGGLIGAAIGLFGSSKV